MVWLVLGLGLVLPTVLGAGTPAASGGLVSGPLLVAVGLYSLWLWRTAPARYARLLATSPSTDPAPGEAVR